MNSTIKSAYAFRHRDDVISASSSGGAFTAICEVLFADDKNNVVVYGAAFDSEMNVTHQRAQSMKECFKFRESKYVQSNMSGTLAEVKKDIEKGKTVLFTGTPCQVYAVKHFCEVNNINTEKLVLVDIICHGTVKPKVWDKYKLWLENKYKSKIQEFHFRYKGSRWKQYPVMVLFKNGKKLVNTHDARLYTTLFFSKLPLRESCYKCNFANLNRPSDISIGDFWGIQKVMPDFPKGNGVSEMLINTEKGEKIIQSIIDRNNDIQIEQCKSKGYIKYQHNLNRPTEKPAIVDQFNKDFEEKDFDYILRKYAGNNVKGKIKHCIKKFCGETGLTALLKTILKR